MTVGWQKLRVPLLERLALSDMAYRRGETEEEALARCIREACIRECQREGDKREPRVSEANQPQEVCQHA